MLSHLLECQESEFLLHKLRAVVVPKCWEEFSRVVARGEFVTLGLVLCACTARVGYCLGGSEGDDGNVSVEVEDDVVNVEEDEIGEIVGREMVEETGEVEEGERNDFITPSQLTELAAEVLEETITSSDVRTPSMLRIKAMDSEVGEIQPPAKKKRRKRRGNEIDDLFSQLG
jgi:hypothetical protein